MSFYAWPYPPPPDAPPVTSITTEGDHFLINGKRQHIRGFTDFRGFMLWARHGSMSPLALQMKQTHHDFVSLSTPALTPVVTLMNPWGETEELGVDSFDPRNDPEFFNKLDSYLAAMNNQGFIPFVIVFAWTRLFAGMDLAWKRQFLKDSCAVISRHVALVSLVLEYNTGDSDINPLDFDMPPGVIISRGSAGEDGDPVQPMWMFGEVHPTRGDKWLQHIADSGYSFRRDNAWGDGNKPAITIPIVNSEPNGFGEIGDGRETNPRDSFTQAVDDALWFGSHFFHCEAGTRSQAMPHAQTQHNSAILAWRGVQAVPEVP